MSNPLQAWLELERRVLKATRPVEVEFAAVNLSHGILPFHQAILWVDGAGVVALSGISTVDGGTPMVQWLNKVLGTVAVEVPSRLAAEQLPKALAAQWREWLPPHAALVPSGDLRLLVTRDNAFSDNELALLERLADLVRVTRTAPPVGKRRPGRGRRWLGWVAAGLVLAIGFVPVRGSVLAPAESAAAHPALARAPLDGVIDTIAVKPNEPVHEGQVLFTLDSTTLAGRLNVARQGYATAEAEYRLVVQAMVFDPKAKAQVTILAGKAEERAAEVRLLESQLERVQVRAPQAGIAVFDDPADWIGRPVAVGEKVMAITDETDTEVEAWVAVADIGEVRPGQSLTLFLNSAPLSPLKAAIRSVAYEPQVRPNGSIAHRVRATLAEQAVRPRLGLKGTARIDGDTVPLVWWLFRRPLTTLRQMVGF